MRTSAPRSYEGFSMTPIEAAYTGCPPLMSEIPAHRAIAQTLFPGQAGDLSVSHRRHAGAGSAPRRRARIRAARRIPRHPADRDPGAGRVAPVTATHARGPGRVGRPGHAAPAREPGRAGAWQGRQPAMTSNHDPAGIQPPRVLKDYFISRAGDDAPWAQWIAWQLEAAGYSVIVQDWDFGPGGNFISSMRDALDTARTTIAVYSPAYFASKYTEDEWTAALVRRDDGAIPFLPGTGGPGNRPATSSAYRLHRPHWPGRRCRSRAPPAGGRERQEVQAVPGAGLSGRRARLSGARPREGTRPTTSRDARRSRPPGSPIGGMSRRNSEASSLIGPSGS